MMSDLTERLRNDAAYDRWNLGEGEVSNAAEAADRIEELEMEVHLRDGRIEALERDLLALTDTHDPVARGGHCTFCHHPMGLSVFGPDMLDSQLHYDDCLWIARRALEAEADR